MCIMHIAKSLEAFFEHLRVFLVNGFSWRVTVSTRSKVLKALSSE